MQAILYNIYLTVIFVGAAISIFRYKHLDKALRFIGMLLLLTVVSETVSYILIQYENYDARYTVYHFYNIIQLLLISLFFIYAIKPDHHEKYTVMAFFTAPLIGILNIIFFQPIDKLNTNMLMFESFVINTMALYLIYRLVKHNTTLDLFRSSHFQIALALLILWSSTFFFWGLIPVLSEDKWRYMQIAAHSHTVLNILIYSGIAIILMRLPKRRIHGHS